MTDAEHARRWLARVNAQTAQILLDGEAEFQRWKRRWFAAKAKKKKQGRGGVDAWGRKQTG